jgi:cell division protein FtsW (lipid II flippase)
MFFSIILKYLNILSYSYRTEINEKNRIYKKYTELFRKQISTLQILCILIIIIIINPPKSQWQGLTWIIMSYLCKFLFSVS